MAKKSNEPIAPKDTDANYIEFVIGPLRDRWQEDGPKRRPRSLDEVAEHFGERSFEAYRIGRHRQWMLLQLDNILAKTNARKKDADSGQVTLF